MKGLMYDLVSIGILVVLIVASITGSGEDTVKSVMHKVANSSSTTISELVK